MSTRVDWKWGAARHKRHLFTGELCELSRCETAYSTDCGVNFNSKAAKCLKCLELEKASQVHEKARRREV